MAEETKRFGMMWKPGAEASVGYFPQHLDTNNNGWVGQSYQIRQQALGLGKKYHEQSLALLNAKPNSPPELPDVQARNARARADAKKLAALKNQMAAIDSQIKQKESELVPFDYQDGGTIGFLKRQEMRSQLKSMSPEDRQNKMRTYQWRRAALESEPELSGLSESMWKALTDETVQAFWPQEVAGIKSGREALESIATTVRTVEKAIDYELRATTITDTGPPPEDSGEKWS